jgi:hypothetical protein
LKDKKEISASLGRLTQMLWCLEGRDDNVTLLPSMVAVSLSSCTCAVLDPNSMLAMARTMIALRKSSAALREGDFIALDAPDPVLAFERVAGGERMLCVFNLGGDLDLFIQLIERRGRAGLLH